MSSSEQPNKKIKLDPSGDNPDRTNAAVVRLQRAAFLSSLSRPISPPSGANTSISTNDSKPGDAVAPGASSLPTEQTRSGDRTIGCGGTKPSDSRYPSTPLKSSTPAQANSILRAEFPVLSATPQHKTPSSHMKLIPSPFTLTRIRDLTDEYNKDTVTLGDLLGHPMIRQAWIFNFCFDVDWVMQHFDPDVRDLVSVKIVHGSWRREDGNKQRIDDACKRYVNVASIPAYLPDPFGTHHTKMIVLFRHDDLAQVIIHTANMLPKDWTNMTQAVWSSPLLPTTAGVVGVTSSSENETCSAKIGSGERFKFDLLSYFGAYGNKLRVLVDELQKFDFGAVRGALVGSVPSKAKVSAATTSTKGAWGHLALQNVLTALPTPAASSVSSRKRKTDNTEQMSLPEPHIVCQVSSIATLRKNWLHDVLFRALSRGRDAKFSIIYPTAEDVRISLDGYAAGGSIHTKIESTAQHKQVEDLRPHLCHWAGGKSVPREQIAGRSRAAPHIKTYIEFESMEDDASIKWALLTSANLSTQAWGTAPAVPKSSKSQDAEVHVQSFELGVLVWPELYTEDFNDTLASSEGGLTKSARMVPVFGQNTPGVPAALDGTEQPNDVLVGLRMPYDLPLCPYKPSEVPWSPNSAHTQPDVHGRTWPPKIHSHP